MHAADAEADQSAPRSASAAIAFTIVTPTLGAISRCRDVYERQRACDK
jgi:hypothetical protein